MILEASQYTRPKDGSTTMFDFYALYALWWDIGSGKVAYGYPQNQVGTYGRSTRIDRMMEESAHAVAQGLVDETWNAAVDEASHAVESFVIPYQEAWEWFKQSHSRMKLGRVLLNDIHSWSYEISRRRAREAKNHTSWDELASLFSHPMWGHTGFIDDEGISYQQSYGGPPWVTICYAAKDLERKLSHSNLLGIISSVDRFYDLEHNSATIGEKLSTMQVTRSDLDRRASMRSVSDFLPVVSPPVANIIRASIANPVSPPGDTPVVAETRASVDKFLLVVG